MNAGMKRDIYIYLSNIYLAFPSVVLFDLTVYILSCLLFSPLGIDAPILSCHSINFFYLILSSCRSTFGDGLLLVGYLQYTVKSITYAVKTCAGNQNRGACSVLSGFDSNHYREHVLVLTTYKTIYQTGFNS